MNYQGPGRYRHYKGGEYEVLGIAQPEERGGDIGNGEHLQVAYRQRPDARLAGFDFWLRPVEDFNALIKGMHRTVPRFEKIAEFRDPGVEEPQL